MRILHVLPTLSVKSGGLASSVIELALGLAREGVEIYLYSTQKWHDTVPQAALSELKAAGVEIRCFPITPIPWFGNRYAYSRPMRAALNQIVSKVDLVHIHALWLYPTLAASRICRRVRVPYIISPCGMLDRYSLGSRTILKRLYEALFERKTLEQAAAIHVTSAAEAREISMFGIQRPHVIVPCSIRMEAIPDTPPGSFRRRHPEIGQRKILLFLGRLTPKKRLDLVVEAFAQIAKQRNDVHLVVVGPDEGPGLAAKRELKRLGLLERSTFSGALTGKEKWAAFRESSLFLLPSRDENFGIAALEALAVGLPVLVSQQVALSDSIARAKAGLVVDGNSAKWANEISRLLDNSNCRNTMGQAARKLVATEFQSRRVAVAMRDAYTQFAQRKAD